MIEKRHLCVSHFTIMMKRRLLLLIAMIAVMATAGAADLKAARELRAKLPSATCPSDSLKILVDLFDAQTLSERGRLAKEIFPLARRLDRADLQLDLLTQLATAYSSNDSAMALIIKEAEKFPESDFQREVLTYVRIVKHVAHEGGYPDTEAHREEMARITKRLSEPMPDDASEVTERIYDMFTVISYLQRQSPGVLLDDILLKLDHTIKRLQLTTPMLKVAYFNQSAAAYTLMGNTEKALKADSLYLEALDQTQELALKKGRPYRTCNRNRYIAYRRMLYNHAGLTLPEIQRKYRAIENIALREPDVAADLERNGRARIHYNVAMGNWDKVVPMIKKYIDVPENLWTRRSMLLYLIKGSRALGDKNTEVEALRGYATLMEGFLTDSYDERIRELQIVYGMNDLSERNAILEKERKESIEKNRRAWVVVTIVAIPVLLLLVIGALLMYRKSHRLAADLEHTVNDLQAERDNVLHTQKELIAARDRAQVASRHKTDFINNMTHEIRTPLNAISDYSRLIADCVNDSKHPYLDNYAKLIVLNNELVQTMVNDVLEISEIDNSRLKIKEEPSSVKEMCRMAVESVRHYLRPGVKLEFAEPEGKDITVHTDPRRVEQVLLNLLNNAAKFTSEGSIKLSYEVVGQNLVFAVTDTGSGIPQGKEELIFERFEKLDNSTQGAGLGLPIARLVAGMLKGTVVVDRSYTGGSRFLFTIPLR